MSHDWPPLIVDASRPTWRKWRDRAMTMAMWLVMALLFFDQLTLFGELARKQLTSNLPLEFKLGPFLAVACLLIAWLIAWGLASVRNYRRVTVEPTPPPLDLDKQAARVGVAADVLASWRTLPVAVVHPEQSGRSRVEAPPALNN